MSSTVERGEDLRYGFGRNWAEFIAKNFSEEVVEGSRAGLAEFLRLDSLKGLSFLDIGCGSGLHSLAAHRLGADRVVSFDYDPNSVATARQLRGHAGNPDNWSVMQGSVLDPEFVASLPKVDIVCSWGVLHHTGDMWGALRQAAVPMKPDGVLFVALYSADNYIDPPAAYWLKVKRRYNRCGPVGRWLMERWYVWQFHIFPMLKTGANPLPMMRQQRERGMEFWTDVRDWLGGYPMDFAGYRETQEFGKRELGLDLVNSSNGRGNTEFLFCRLGQNAQWTATEAGRQLLPLTPPFGRLGEHGYTAYLPALRDSADANEAPRRSPVMIYEDGRPLGLTHSLHADIAKYGRGRFSHWGDNIYFSTPDNSDPNANGRTYTYCAAY